jgi:hypothetical protein
MRQWTNIPFFDHINILILVYVHLTKPTKILDEM